MVFGAAVAPRKLQPVAPKPGDFDAFWKAKIAGLEAIPENAVLTPGESYSPDVDYATIQMDHVNGTHVYGQLAKPKTPGKHPAILVLQWASPPYPLQKPWVIELAKQGWLALNIEPHTTYCQPRQPLTIEPFRKRSRTTTRSDGTTATRATSSRCTFATIEPWTT